MRNTFIDALTIVASGDPRIQLLVGDLGYSVIESFQNQLPNQFHNIGVAEQNMIGVAAGMAHQGLRPFCYSIANFPLFRPAEFVRNLIDYHRLDVTIVAVGGGLAYGNLGYTHHAVQDFAFVNSLLNFTVCAPADPSQVPYVMEHCLLQTSPKYVRLNRNGEQKIIWHETNALKTKFFSNEPIKDGSKSAIVTTGISGYFVEKYLLQSDKLRKKFPRLHVNIPIWGSNELPNVKSTLDQFDEIIVFEDHISHGGFGDWIRNLSVNAHVVKYSLVDDFVGLVGTQDFFFESYIISLEQKYA